MGGATIWPVPRALDAEAHQYPRKWKRNMLFLYGGAFLIGLQFNRYALMCRVSLEHEFVTYLVYLAIHDESRRIHGLGKPQRT